MGRRWTKEDDEYVIQNYRFGNVENIAKHLNRSYDAVVARAYQTLKVNTRWSAEEEAFMESHIGMTNEWIAKQLGRKVSSIKSKRDRNYESIVDSRVRHINLEEAVRLSGIANTTLRRYARDGMFKVVKVGKYRFVTIDNFMKFLKENKDKWDATKCEKWFFENEAWFKEKHDADFKKMQQKRWGEFY